MAEGGWSSGAWGEAGWGGSVYTRTTDNTAAASSTAAGAARFTPLVAEYGAAIATDTTAQSIYSAKVQDAVVVVADTEVAQVDFGVLIAENVNATDAPIGGLTFDCHTLELVDSLDTPIAQAEFNGNAVIEGVSGVDSPYSNTILPVTITEFVDCSEEIDSAVGLYNLIFEGSSVGDLYSSQVTFGTVVSEASTAEAETSSLGVFTSAISESAAVQTSQSAAAIFVSTVLAGANASDSTSRRFLWEIIDDSQANDWQLIDTTQ